ncbi:hypothetical protein Taro_022289, partial [Colocasia esculenta]|nr:hypothetical protein [Colocasia esculenta]
VAGFLARSKCELRESITAVAGCACCERGCCFRSCCGWVRPRPARLCECVAKAERAYVWCGLHQCRVVVCGTGRRCPCLVGYPFLVGVCVVLAVLGLVCLGAVVRCALCSAQLASLLELSRCFVCRVAPLVERCDTCLWLLSALCWLVVDSGEVLPEFFSAGSGGGEVFPRTLLCSFLVVAALPSRLRCIAWLLCSGSVFQNCLLLS